MPIEFEVALAQEKTKKAAPGCPGAAFESDSKLASSQL
jgi:hypothetical protein